MGVSIMAMLQAGESSVQCVIIWFASIIPFFSTTWEELHTGALDLGFPNGPTDGVLIVSASFLVSALMEDYTEFWDTLLMPGVSRKWGIIVFFVICVTVTFLANILSVLR